MSIYKKNQTLDVQGMDGIWLDFQKNTWVFYIKDEVWQTEEVQRTEHSDVTITFIQKGITDAFLLEIFDCLEVSDIPFSMKEAEGDILTSLKNNDIYEYEIVLLDEKNTVCAVRDGSFGKEDSAILKKKLSARLEENFTVEDAEASYNKLVQRYEPYELEEFAVFIKKN